jgi:hypothetical protein
MADGAPMVTLESAMAEADAVDFDQRPGAEAPGRAERLAVPLVAAAVGGTIEQAPGAKEVIRRTPFCFPDNFAGSRRVRSVMVGARLTTG